MGVLLQSVALDGVGGEDREAAEAERDKREIKHDVCSFRQGDGGNIVSGASIFDWEMRRRA
jgi:hypothetical protein